MKLAQQTLLNLLKVGAIICYLLLLFIHFNPKSDRSTSTDNIIDTLEHKMLVLGIVMDIIMISLSVQTTVNVNDRSTNTYNIIDKLEYKMLVLGMFIFFIMFSLLVQIPIDVIDTVLPTPKYIP